MKEEVLTSRQVSFLEKVGQNRSLAENFYLTGGTALAAFYLAHRYSEDLDFFSEKEFDALPIDIFLKQIKGGLGAKKIDYQQSFNRNLFFLEYNKKEVLKTEFTFFPFPRLEQGPAKFGLSVDSLLDIAVNKLFTIYQRSQARDYIDLYCICKERRLRLDDLIKKAKLKFDWHIDPLQLGTQFTKAGEAKDFPRLIKKINHKDWQKFFVNEAKKLRNQILE